MGKKPKPSPETLALANTIADLVTNQLGIHTKEDVEGVHEAIQSNIKIELDNCSICDEQFALNAKKHWEVALFSPGTNSGAGMLICPDCLENTPIKCIREQLPRRNTKLHKRDLMELRQFRPRN